MATTPQELPRCHRPDDGFQESRPTPAAPQEPHERKPGIGPLAGWRSEDDTGRGPVNPEQIDRYIENGGVWIKHVPENAGYFKPWNTDYQDWAVETGLYDSPQPYLFQLYVEPLQKFNNAANGIGDHQPPENMRDQLKRVMSPLPIWYPTATVENEEDYPLDMEISIKNLEKNLVQ